MLGGYGKLTPIDVESSGIFINKVKSLDPQFQFDKAVDCGAGIGRVTKNLLLPLFSHVDLVEQSVRLLESSASYIGNDSVRTTLINEGLQVTTIHEKHI